MKSEYEIADGLEWHDPRHIGGGSFLASGRARQRIRVLQVAKVVAGRLFEIGERDLERAVGAENETFHRFGPIALLQKLPDQLALAQEVGRRVELLLVAVDHDDHLPEL